MTRTPRCRTRPGFTLVELMVAAAVCVIIMTVLATAFQLSIDTTRQMRSIGGLMDQLRGATIVIQADLKADHFLPEDGKPDKGVKVSNQRLDLLNVTGSAGNYKLSGWTPPRAGFFRISNSLPTPEGVDTDGLASSRATNHYLHFTSILSGASDKDEYVATVGGTQVKSRAAEIAYFLDPAQIGTTSGTTPLPLFHLIRRQRLAALNTSDAQRLPTTDPGVISLRQITSGPPSTFAVNTLANLTNPANRLKDPLKPTETLRQSLAPRAATGNDGDFAPLTTRPGDDILLSNVISFEVLVNWGVPATGGSGLAPFAGPAAFDPVVQKTDFPFDALPTVPVGSTGTPKTPGSTTTWPGRVFDTWSSSLSGWDTLDQTTGALAGPNVPPLLIQVKAVQIRIRIWDPKLNNARQITIVRDL